MALCDMESINLIYISYDKKLKQENNFECHIAKIEYILKLWKMGPILTTEQLNII